MKPRILYVTHRVPFPPDRGDRIRTWNILKFLAARADVDLACLADEPVEQSTMNELRRTARRVIVVPHGDFRRYLRGAASMLCGDTVTEGLFRCGALARIIKAWNHDTVYDAAIASSSGIADYVLPPNVTVRGQVWIDLIDVDSQKWLDYSAASRWPMSAVYQCEGVRLRALESRIAGQADRLLVVTDAERQLFHSFHAGAPVHAVGNGVDTEYFCPDNATVQKQSCVFVGVMDYKPNVDAVCWFVREVWPEIRSRFPHATFNIVGKSPAPEVTALSGTAGVTVTGPVPDVRPWLHQATCVVVPLRIARGVQNKVLEAMACARPVICSPAPLQGLAVEPGLQLLEAETAEEWFDSVTKVFEDSGRAEELGIAANAWVQTNHRWDLCLQDVRELLQQPEKLESTELEVTP
jgi:sugar transferase (PEP-CTERM/EpsH1 system associated)